MDSLFLYSTHMHAHIQIVYLYVYFTLIFFTHFLLEVFYTNPKSKTLHLKNELTKVECVKYISAPNLLSKFFKKKCWQTLFSLMRGGQTVRFKTRTISIKILRIEKIHRCFIILKRIT